MSNTSTPPPSRKLARPRNWAAVGYLWLKTSHTVKFLATLGEIGGKLAIFVALVSWFIEAPDRAKQKHYEAWQVINSAHEGSGNGGRSEALRDLIDDGVLISNIDLKDADLSASNLSGGQFLNVHFVRVNLSYAKFNCIQRRTIKSLFIGKTYCTNITGGDFGNALVDTQFVGASLGHADIGGVQDANFSQATLVSINIHSFGGKVIFDKAKIYNSTIHLSEGNKLAPDFGQSLSFKGAILVDVDLVYRGSLNDLSDALICRVKINDVLNNRDCDKIPNKIITQNM